MSNKEKLNELLNLIAKKSQELHALKSQVESEIDRLAPDLFEVNQNQGGVSLKAKIGLMNVKLLDFYFKDWFGDENEVRTFVKLIHDQMKEQDFPVPERDLPRFFEFFGCSEAEKLLLKAAASTNEAYDHWVEEEKRMMSY